MNVRLEYAHRILKTMHTCIFIRPSPPYEVTMGKKAILFTIKQNRQIHRAQSV